MAYELSNDIVAIILSMDAVLKDLISTQHDMMVTESAVNGMQAFHHHPNNAASCFYKHKLMNELKASHKRSDYSNGAADAWHNRYYGGSPPPLTAHNNSFVNNVSSPKHYPSLLPSREQHQTDNGFYPPNLHHHSYHQQTKAAAGAYYPHPAVSSTGPHVPSNAAVLHWQQSIQQQHHHQIHQRLTHPQAAPQLRQEDAITNPANNRFTDMFLRSQNPAGYLLSLNEHPQSWSQPSAAVKDGLFQPSISKNICPMCGKNYARPSTLKTHMRIHSGERPFHCKVCNKSFSQAANLTAHLRVHSGEKPFSCPVCHKTFSQSSSVTTHMRTHSGDRPYKCPVCRKGFSDSSTLTKHLRIHSGEKPYRCNFCSMSFSQSGNLNRHMKVHEQHHKPESTASSSPRTSPN